MRARSTRRLIIFVLALGAAVWLFIWLIGKKGDIQLPSDTSTLIGALKTTGSGTQAVVIEADGKVTESKGHVETNTDRDLAWSPDGNRLFFISDRKDDSFHIFRWDAKRGTDPEQRSIDKAGRSNLVFDVQKTASDDLSALVTVRGTVQEFFPVNGKSAQLLPPSKQRIAAEDGGGAGNTFELMYNRFGKSFRVAKWIKSKRFIAAVMRREERGEALIIQDLLPDEKGNIRPPMPVFDAERLEIQVDPATGNLILTVLEVIPPIGQDGKQAKLPFKNGIFIVDPTAEPAKVVAPIVAFGDLTQCAGDATVSPDGSTLLFVIGKYGGDGNYTPMGLGSCPLKLQGGATGARLDVGLVSDPTYSPDGKKIAYIKREGANRALFLADADGKNAKNLTAATGDYSKPTFSPQYK